MLENQRIIFMGTPVFAAQILKYLIENKVNVVACVTAPDRPAGRGQQIKQSDVKKVALDYKIPVLQPEKLTDTAFQQELINYNADIFVIVAFRMLPKAVWQIPKNGTFNLHASLLPAYRGAAPIHWSIMNGETETGLTTFLIDESIDTGAIILQEKLAIGANETVGELHDRMMLAGGPLILKTINILSNGEPSLIDQENTNQKVSYAPKLNKENTKILWHKNIDVIHNHIRGLSPFPVAWTTIRHKDHKQEKLLKIYSAEKVQFPSKDKIGWFQTSDKRILVQLADGVLQINELQLEGKKRMSASAFLAGFPVEDWVLIFD